MSRISRHRRPVHRRSIISDDVAFASIGICLAVGSAFFAYAMSERQPNTPLLSGLEYLRVFAQLSTGTPQSQKSQRTLNIDYSTVASIPPKGLVTQHAADPFIIAPPTAGLNDSSAERPRLSALRGSYFIHQMRQAYPDLSSR